MKLLSLVFTFGLVSAVCFAQTRNQPACFKKTERLELVLEIVTTIDYGPCTDNELIAAKDTLKGFVSSNSTMPADIKRDQADWNWNFVGKLAMAGASKSSLMMIDREILRRTKTNSATSH